MSEKRTASEIRAYCEEYTQRGSEIYGRLDDDDLCEEWQNLMILFGCAARTDLPRLLDAAVKLREALWDSNVYLTTDGIGFKDPRVMGLYVDTLWLAEPPEDAELSPEPALSPDGESGEESEA